MSNINALPQKVHRCSSCFMNIFDDSEHICFAQNPKASWLRTGVYGATPFRLFATEINGKMSHLNADTQKFDPIFDGMVLLSPPTDGLVRFKQNGNFSTASYAAASLKRFSIIIATNTDVNCHLLFRIMISANHGLEFSKLDSELQAINGRFVLPKEYNLNTAMVLGLPPTTLSMTFRIYANESGSVDYTHFNGLCTSGFIGSKSELSEFKVI